MSFVHLHNHSHYSLLDGLSKIDQMVEKAAGFGMPALALTDHGNLYGAIDFYKKCRAAGIKPIIGMEAYIAWRTRRDKEPNIDNRRYHLTLLAKNLAGYHNLLQLVTASHLEGFYYKPRMDKELLRTRHEGLICLSGCLGSELCRSLWNRDYLAAERVAREHQEIFGAENYYLEIMHHPKLERQTEIKDETIKLAKRLDIPLVATQDAHYLNLEDAQAHDTLIAIQTNEADETRRFFNKEEDFSFIGSEEAAKRFHETPEATKNTLKIAAECNLELALNQWVFPEFPIPLGSNSNRELHRLVAIDLKNYLARNPERRDEASKRAAHELNVIDQKGFAPYFLVVADIIAFAHQRGIFTNTRGSAAGSLVSYLLNITNVDPLTYRLPFERFLNPERPSPPDIDMDFADKRRDEVINYVKQKYGEDKVAQIGTFGSMMARGAIRDVARALGFPYSFGDKLSRQIPLGSQGFPMSLNRALTLSPELRQLYEAESDVKKIIDLAKKIEGCARHISVHAAGVIIAPRPLTEFVPLQFDPRGDKIISQYEMKAVESVGLLKFDFLGIRNLSILENSIRLVGKTLNQKINIENIPLDDKTTFEILARGETVGLFQLNGAGMTRWLKELKPTAIHDINAMVALYRPGPMESIPEYVRRKHNPRLIKYLDPRLKKILGQTYGVIAYQDDVMEIAVQLGGYSWQEADKLRKAMGKKIPREMAAQKEKLIAGLIRNGLAKHKAEALWRLIEPFAAYGFNKAHAASYGRVAYQTAYMKARFPSEYMTAVLSAEAGDTEKIAEAINECYRLDLLVLPPDINESFGDFTVIKGQDGEKDRIRFGLFTIKNLGAEIAEQIVEERKRAGPFRTIADFLERVRHRNLNKKSLESLIKAGALDSFGEERGKLLYNLESLIAYHQGASRQDENQSSLFGLMADPATLPALRLKETPPISPAEKLSWEKELLGLYLSGHPLEKFRNKFNENNSISRIRESAEGQTVTVGGLLEEIKAVIIKNGEQMAFGRIADFSGSIEIVCFSRVFSNHRHLIQPEKCVAVEGRLSHRNNGLSIVVEHIKELTTKESGSDLDIWD